jgi:predicted permease
MSVALLILPDFLLIALGWALCHKLNYAREFFDTAERLVFSVLFPALLFQSIRHTPLRESNAVLLAQAVALTVLAGVALAWLAAPLLRPHPRAQASAAQCGFRFNTYMALGLSASLAGAQGQAVMGLIAGLAIPLVNIAAVYGLARQSGGNPFTEILRNPLVLATMLGLACNLAGLELPRPASIVLDRLGSASLALGLMCVGASLTWGASRGHGRLIGWMIAVKLLVMPLCALAAAWLLGLPALETRMLLLFWMLPTASTTYVLAVRMGGDGPLVAQIISLGTLISALTIPAWLLLTT